MRHGRSILAMSGLKGATALFVAGALSLAPGCTEFSHFGQVSNRMTSAPVNDVKMEQQKSDGKWKTIGYSDGKGAWNILKMQVSGGGPVRLTKPGYAPLVMDESEFLSQNVILLTPTEEQGWGEGVSE